MPELKIGGKAPAFALPNQNGRKVSLKDDLKGSWSVVYFYPKDMTPGCTKEACSFRDASRTLKSRGIKVVGVSADSPERHQKFIAKEKLNFDLLSDENHAMMEKYGAWGEKKLYGKSFLGIKRMTYLLDPEGRIRHVWKKVDTSRHADQVLEKYETLEDAE